MSTELSRIGVVPPHIAKACSPTEKMDPIQQLARATITDCLPTLHFYYKTEKRNPHAQDAEDFLIKWLKDHDISQDPKFIAGFKANRFAPFAAHCSPDADKEVSETAGALAGWLFFSDDVIEVSEDAVALEHQFRTVEAICADPTVVDASFKPSQRGLAAIVKKMHAICTDVFKQRFTKSVTEYLKSNLWELENVESGRTPPVEEYKRMRYFTSATPLSFHMIELDKRLGIPDEIYYGDPDVVELLRSGAFCCNNQNEILSYFKERKQALEELKKQQKTGEPVIHNLIAVFMNQDTSDDPEAVKMKRAFVRTAEELKMELKTFYDLAEKVKMRDFGPYTEQVKQLADGIADWISAHHFWSVFAPRYGGPGFEAIA